MAKGVFTRLKRFTLVEKTASEVGVGTAYPLLVTRDQLAEIFYRVKDVVFSGSVSADYGFTNLEIIVDGAAPNTDFHSGTTSDVICERSYVDTQAPPVNTVDEPLIWTQAHDIPEPPAGTTILTRPQYHGIVTGLTHYVESFALPSSDYHVRGDDGTGEYLAAVELAFSGEVAWVDTNASGNPFDSANELYVGLGFSGYTSDGTAAIVDVYTVAEATTNEGVSGDLSIVLATGTLTCQLYCSNFGTPSFPILSSAYSSLTITATEWWPYQAGNPGADVWDSATGLVL